MGRASGSVIKKLKIYLLSMKHNSDLRIEELIANKSENWVQYLYSISNVLIVETQKKKSWLCLLKITGTYVLKKSCIQDKSKSISIIGQKGGMMMVLLVIKVTSIHEHEIVGISALQHSSISSYLPFHIYQTLQSIHKTKQLWKQNPNRK